MHIRPEVKLKPGLSACSYPPAKIPVVTRFYKIFCCIFMFFAISVRLGEAAVPGPHLFANANPTGLMGKSADLASLGKTSATFAVQETHLTTQGISRFRKEMAWQKTNFHMTHGAPAPPKNQSIRTLGGKHNWSSLCKSPPLA